MINEPIICIMTKIKCPWCQKEVVVEEYIDHIDSHKNPDYDRKLIQESPNIHYSPPKGIEPEMIKFTKCFASKLTLLPSPSEYPSGSDGVIAKFLKTRIAYEKEIYDIFMGNRSLGILFSNATRSWDVDKYKLSKMFYDCLEGINSEEAIKIRASWGKLLDK